MEIEQRPPEQPNFLMIVILFCVTIVVIFVLAILFIHVHRKHLGFPDHHAHPTSQLVLPAPTGTSSLA
ncbi:MAG: hypothetical protein WBY53_19695 [Acidobacteriaceae bacterium]